MKRFIFDQYYHHHHHHHYHYYHYHQVHLIKVLLFRLLFIINTINVVAGRVSSSASSSSFSSPSFSSSPTSSSSKLPRTIRIGGLFSTDQLEQQLVFHAAIERINAHYVNRTVFEPVVEQVPKDNAFLTHFKTCSLLRHGPVAIVGPFNEINSLQVQSICEHLEVPHIETRLALDYSPKSDLSVHMFPHLSTLTSVYLELISAWEWTTFAIVYQEADSVLHFKDFFEAAKVNGWEMKFYQLPGPEVLLSSPLEFISSSSSSSFSSTPSPSYRDVLWKLKEAKHENILLDVRSEHLIEVLRQTQQVGLLTRRANLLITSLDLHTLDLEYFRHSQSNITSLRIVREDHPLLKTLLAEWPSTSARFMPPRSMVARPRHGHLSAHSAMIFDGVELLARALVELERFETREISCEAGSSWQYGATILNYVRQVHLEGLTGYVAFDALTGFRSNVSFDVISTVETGYEVIARWNGSGLEKTPLWNKHSTSEDTLRLIRVTTVMNDPFMMMANNSKELHGNDRYEGYIVDLMKEIAQLMRFRFEINLVKDKKYGNLNKVMVWDGMVGEVLRDEADIAAADLTITSEREQVVDFTHPFMSTGISILFKRPIIKETSLWSFLSPFSTIVWMYLLAVFAGVSLILFYVGRFTPYEWTNPHPCPHHEPVLENTLTTRNSFWCTIGSLMQQGSDVAPKALSTRIITSIWYFFTLIIVSSYTANLAAFLTVENVHFPFKDVHGLAEQTKIQYGCLANGATHKFFNRSKIPTYQKIAANLEKYADSWLVKKNAEGRERVEERDGKYAFFMESATIEYIQERYCNLTQIGGLIDNKGYGIATKKGSPLRGPLTEAILKLQETGVLHMLKDRWWKQKGGGQCIAKPPPAMTELGVRNLGGVFLVLAVGGLVAIFLAVCEFLFKTKMASEEGDYGRNLWADFTFALSCWESTKVLKRKSVKSLSGSLARVSESANRIVVSPSTEAFPLATYS